MANQAILDLQAQLRAELDTQIATLDVAESGPGDKISTANSIFRLPDGTISEGPLTAIVLDWRYTRGYWESSYDGGGQPPLCAASHKAEVELKPRASIENPQSDSCAECPHDQWGSAPVGKGKACKNKIILAVVPEKPTADMTPWRLELPPTSIKPFTQFVKQLATKAQLLPLQVKVDISFNKQKSWMQLEFNNPKPHEHLAVAVALRTESQMVLDQ